MQGSSNLGYLLHRCLRIPHPIRSDSKALEVGCGDGDLAALLARSGYLVTAIDSDPAAIAIARAKHSNQERLTFAVSKIDEGFPDTLGTHFQYVVSAFAFHHLRAIQDTVHALRNILITSGTFDILDLYADHRASVFTYLLDQHVGRTLLSPLQLIRDIRSLGLRSVARFNWARLNFSFTSSGVRHIREDLRKQRPPSLSEWRQILRQEGTQPITLSSGVIRARLFNPKGASRHQC